MKKIITIIFIALFYSLTYAQQPQPLWKFKTNGKIVGSACVTDTKIIIGSEDGFLYAVDKASGNESWKFKTGSALRSTPAYVSGTVFINNLEGNLYAIDANSGKLKWTFATTKEKVVDFWDYYLASPAIYNGLVLMGTGNGTIYAIDQQSGKEKWSYKTEGVVHADPLVYNKTIYVGSFDGNCYAINADSGQLLWKFKTVGDSYFPKGEIQNGASVFNNMILFGSRDFNIYALNADKGYGMWNMKERGSWVIATPVVSDSLVFFGTSDTHAFYCLDAFSSEIKWRVPLNMRVYGKAAFYKDLVLFGCFNGKLYAADKKTGAVKWEYQTEASKQNWLTIFDESGHFKKGFELYGDDAHIVASEKTIMSLGSFLSSPIIEQNIAYIGSADGYLYALKL